MRKPLIIGHRGASADAPENTLIAFDQALDAGADGIEFDVRLASDGVPVVIHDSNLKRTGLRSAVVAKLTSKQLGQVDVGSWFNLRFPRRAQSTYTSATIPTLLDVLGHLRDRDAVLYVELKCNLKESHRLVNEVANLIKEYRIQNRVTVVSFSLDSIAEIKRIDSTISTGALFEPKLTRPFRSSKTLIARALAVNADEILWHSTMAGPNSIKNASLNGLLSTVWTADRESWVLRAVRDGMRAIITNYPRRLVEARSVLTGDDTNASSIAHQS